MESFIDKWLPGIVVVTWIVTATLTFVVPVWAVVVIALGAWVAMFIWRQDTLTAVAVWAISLGTLAFVATRIVASGVLTDTWATLLVLCVLTSWCLAGACLYQIARDSYSR